MARIRRSSVVLIAALTVPIALAYLVLWPTPVTPEPWQPPVAPALEGPYATNDALRPVERLAAIGRIGPECVTFDAQQRLYTGYLDGTIVRFDAEGRNGEVLADTGGRPLCIRVLRDGTLIVSDAVKGLLRVAGDGRVEVLADQHDGLPFRLVDEVAIDAAERTAYFTDASHKFGLHQHLRDVLEHGANGRLLRIDLATRETTLLLDDLHFANGVVLAPDGQSLLVGETSSYRLLRYWLEGPRAGTHEVFIDNLPGFPDNITWNGRDRYWLALANPRNPTLDGLGPHPFLRRVVDRLPWFAKPQPARHAFVLGLDVDGRVVANLQYAGPDVFAPVTTACEHAGWLYLGSLSERSLARVRLPDGG